MQERSVCTGTYKTKVCQHCGKEYQPTSPSQKYCAGCAPEVGAEKARVRVTEWREANPEYQAKRYPVNPEKHRTGNAKWYKKNSERERGKNTEWKKTNAEKCKTSAVRWYKAHCEDEKYKLSKANWKKVNPDKVGAISRKQKAKRRSMGWNPLNSHFSNSDGHHVNKSDVIYIPTALHQSVSHDHWTGRGMEQINVLAYRYLTQAAQ